MAPKKVSQGVPLLGIGIIGFFNELVISVQPEVLPIILFGLVAIRGITNFFEKK